LKKGLLAWGSGFQASRGKTWQARRWASHSRTSRQTKPTALPKTAQPWPVGGSLFDAARESSLCLCRGPPFYQSSKSSGSTDHHPNHAPSNRSVIGKSIALPRKLRSSFDVHEAMGPSSRAASAAAAASSSASVGNASRKNHRAKSSNKSKSNSSSSVGHAAAAAVVVRDNPAEMTDDEYLDSIGNYKPGTLRTIRLTNFLTHKDVVIRPGPR
jgi:hypothetical protein